MGDKIISANRVFEFCGVADDIRDTQTNAIDNLIIQTQHELETTLRRSLVSVAVTAETFHHGKNCEIIDDQLRFIGRYRDMYSITSITECGTALVESTAYGDDNDWIYNQTTGIIERVGGAWAQDKHAIVITGAYGYLDLNNDNEVREDIKKLLTEMVAAKSGYWKINTKTPEGNIINTKTTISEDAKRIKKTHINLTL